MPGENFERGSSMPYEDSYLEDPAGRSRAANPLGRYALDAAVVVGITTCGAFVAQEIVNNSLEQLGIVTGLSTLGAAAYHKLPSIWQRRQQRN